ncbi:hypothetical protein [Moorena sp. SIO3A2]|uniref:hypothetical protein n=1 Tax=Moorena sp. SIO3A2 TaxID=2607841 RepID=UPI0013BA00D4|nr:hypothetical protein [Moorena sp. SIO3A2]NER91120.1 hypothetical protein [Moorena sp. SIO3A2]
MSILSELQSRKIGLIELISMGFEVYLKNLKPILLVFSTIYLPFMIIMLAVSFSIQNNPSGLSLVLQVFFYLGLFVFSIFQNIYFIAISVITENYVHGRNTSYQSVVNKILAILVPLFFLGVRYFINIYLRLLLLIIPGIIYAINNAYYGFAFILRDQRGTAAFAYSRSIVKGNWWRVLFFSFLVMLIAFGLQTIFSKLFNIIPILNDFWVSLLSQTLPQFIVIGIGIGSILLFLNLDFQKSLES